MDKLAEGHGEKNDARKKDRQMTNVATESRAPKHKAARLQLRSKVNIVSSRKHVPQRQGYVTGRSTAFTGPKALHPATYISITSTAKNPGFRQGAGRTGSSDR